MSNALAISQQPGGALALAEGELIEVLQSSLYPGASVPSIKMVISYCKASNLDPMQKPVHIVPMKVSSGRKDAKGWDIKENRDVIMPGIGLYRIQGARTGEYAGVSTPVFGPTRTLEFVAESWEDGDNGRRIKRQTPASMEYPEWCEITVQRLVNGIPRDFPAREYWLENYATKSAGSAEPNQMWRKRPFGQIAKCAEAQALRKAFPEVGSAPTADEMAGKSFGDFEGTTIDADTGEVTTGKATDKTVEKKPSLPTQGNEEFAKNIVIWTKVIKSGKKDVEGVLATVATVATLSEAQIAAIRNIPAELAKAAAAAGPSFAQIADAIAKAADEDALDVAASLITPDAIPDEQLRKELLAKYDARRAELNAD